MLLTTAQQLIDSFFLTGEIGTPMVVGSVRGQTTGATTPMLTVPPGQVFLITHIIQQADDNATLGSLGGLPSTSPNLGAVAGISIYDSAGNPQNAISFLTFERFYTTYQQSSSPTFRDAPPSNVVTWRPKYAIPIPEEWVVNCSQTLGNFGNYAAVYGYLVDRASARTLGYTVSDSSTDADRNYGISSFIGDGSITGRTGKSIRILDVHVRMQGEVAGTKNELTLTQHGGAELFMLANANPMEMVNMPFSPEGWFIKEGTDLDIAMSDQGTASINLVYEYVNSSEVPGNVWWTCVRPTLPTPGTGTGGSLGTMTLESTVATLYYPGLDTTKTSPLKGYQHLLRGYAMSLQKTASGTSTDTDETDQVLFTISTGASAASISYDTGSQTNFQFAPVLAAPAQSMVVATVMDDLCIACKQNDGSIFVDALSLSKEPLTTTPTGDVDVQSWAVSMWGMTIPNRFTDPSNRGS